MRRWLVIAVPYLWLLVFFLIPFFIVFKISLSDIATAIPPYTPTFDLSDIRGFLSQLDFENYWFILQDPLYVNAYLSALRIAAISTFLTLLVAYPIAYGMARAPKEWQPTLVMLVILPFWTSFLIRVYAWIGILKKEGLLNMFLMNIGVISEPLTILNTSTAVYIGIVYSYLPFMILPLYTNLEKHDPVLLDAAQDLGANRWQRFWQVTWPQSLPGVFSGSALVFIPVLGMFAIPDILGGTGDILIGNLIKDQFLGTRDWPFGSTLSIMLTLAVLSVAGLATWFARSRTASSN